jgi:hypothetical protein
MPETLRVSTDSHPASFLSNFRQVIRNLFETGGFEPASKTSHRHHRRSMLRSSHSRGIFPVLPRDYVRRRRAIRLISNFVLVVLLSAAVAYAIVHISGSNGFSAPH